MATNSDKTKPNVTTADVMNAGVGVYSLVQGLTNKRPDKMKAARLRGYVRPAQGDEEGLLRTKAEIAQQIGSATRDVTRMAGSDVHKGIAARLGIQANANDALIQAEGNNTQVRRADEVRLSGELNNIEAQNAQYKNQANAANFSYDQENYQRKRAEALQGVGNSLNYVAAKEANMANNKVQENQAADYLQHLDKMEQSRKETAQIIAGIEPTVAAKTFSAPQAVVIPPTTNQTFFAGRRKAKGGVIPGVK